MRRQGVPGEGTTTVDGAVRMDPSADAETKGRWYSWLGGRGTSLEAVRSTAAVETVGKSVGSDVGALSCFKKKVEATQGVATLEARRDNVLWIRRRDDS